MTTAPTTSLTDVQVTILFDPFGPVALTGLTIEPDPGLDHAAVLELLAQAVERLQVYRSGYLLGMQEDAQPAVMPAV